MAEWKEVKLEDVCVPKVGVQTGPFGSQLHQKDYVPLGTPIITVEHLGDNRITRNNLPCVSDYDKERLKKYTLEEGDIVFSRVGSVDRRALVRSDEDGWLFSGRCLRVRLDRKKANPAFVSFQFGTEAFKQHIRSIAVGATMPSINTKILSEVKIVLPPLPEQQAISNVLSALDDKIELNRQMNETLEAAARALFKSWFVDFDPVRAKIEGRAPDGLSADIAALFPDMLVDSPLGEIPKSWEICTIKQSYNLLMGQSPPGSTYNEDSNGLPFFQGRTDFGFRYPNKRIYCSAATRIAHKGDTLVSVRAPVGDINLASEQCCIGRGVSAIRHKSGAKYYTYYAMQNLSEHFKKFEAGGTVFGSINKKDFEDIKIINPGIGLVSEFDGIVQSLDQKIENNSQEILSLSQLRDSLLPKLISGELRVGDADHSLREAV